MGFTRALTAPDTHSTRMKAMMQRSQQNAKKLAQTEEKQNAYKGPYMAGYVAERKFMQIISNQTHSASTNNGYARKPSGGFFFH